LIYTKNEKMDPLTFKNKTCLRHIFALCLFTAATVIGCAGQQLVEYPKPYDSPQRALNIIESNAVSDTITATAKIEIMEQGSRYVFKAALMLKRPGSLRLELMPLIGPPDLFVSIDNGEMRIFIPAKKSFYTGQATAQNIARFLHVFVDGNELISIMMGVPPCSANPCRLLTGSMEEKLYRIDQHREDGKTLSFWIDPLTDTVVRGSLNQYKNKYYEAFFDKYTTLDGKHMPQCVTITGRNTSSMKIRYSAIKTILNDSDSFALRIPDGITPIPLDGQPN